MDPLFSVCVQLRICIPLFSVREMRLCYARALLLAGLLLALRLLAGLKSRAARTAIHFNPADLRMRRLISRTPALHAGYLPTAWCRGMFANVAFAVFKRFWSQLWPLRFRRTELPRPDGGLVSIDWANDEHTASYDTNQAESCGHICLVGNVS